MAYPTVKSTETLNIGLHVDDGSVVGDTVVWKLNDPIGGLSFVDVKNAFGYDTGGTNGYFGSYLAGQNVGIFTKDGHEITGIDSAKTVQTVVTTTELE